MSTSESTLQSASFAAASIQDFLHALAAKSPTPGGGAVAALVGAIAAAQAQMVVEYSVGKKSLAPHQALLLDYRGRLERMRLLFLRLMDEDAAAYAQLSPWLKLPATERDSTADFHAALTAALRAPQSVLALANELLDYCRALIPITNPALASDLGVAQDAAAACGRSALRNVEINLPLLSDIEAQARERAITDELSSHMRKLVSAMA
jgi:formiminotetrahydrofolate cyclodeaminase